MWVLWDGGPAGGAWPATLLVRLPNDKDGKGKKPPRHSLPTLGGLEGQPLRSEGRYQEVRD